METVASGRSRIRLDLFPITHGRLCVGRRAVGLTVATPTEPLLQPRPHACARWLRAVGSCAPEHHAATALSTTPPTSARIALMSEQAPCSVLSDGTITRLVEAGRIRIDPWDETLVQPASIDLRLGDSFRVFHNHKLTAIDLRDPPEGITEQIGVREGDPFVIHPGEFCLGRTLERVELPG